MHKSRCDTSFLIKFTTKKGQSKILTPFLHKILSAAKATNKLSVDWKKGLLKSEKGARRFEQYQFKNA